MNKVFDLDKNYFSFFLERERGKRDISKMTKKMFR